MTPRYARSSGRSTTDSARADPARIKVAVVGLGKMGLSHLAIARTHPDVELAAVCDSSSYVLGVLEKYTGVTGFSDYEKMLDAADPDAVIIATPSRTHASMVRTALSRGKHVFCEKPFVLDSREGEALVALARSRGVVTQVGYHNRFVGAFQEAKSLLDAGAIGTVTHALGEAYGPVVTRPKGSTWRSRKEEGGGCLYDYAAHPIDLVTWYLGEPVGVGGTVLNRIFSRETEDEVFSTLHLPGDSTAQISVNWSDASYRKMTTRVTLWGTAGRIYVDRQEIQVFLRDEGTQPPAGYGPGWNVRYTTDLTVPVWFYLRGEEYSAQIHHFVRAVKAGRPVDGFASALVTDRVIEMLVADAAKGPSTQAERIQVKPAARWARSRRPRLRRIASHLDRASARVPARRQS